MTDDKQLAMLFGSVDAARRELRRAAGAMPRGHYKPKDDLVDEAVRAIYLAAIAPPVPMSPDEIDLLDEDDVRRLLPPRMPLTLLRPGAVAAFLLSENERTPAFGMAPRVQLKKPTTLQALTKRVERIRDDMIEERRLPADIGGLAIKQSYESER